MHSILHASKPKTFVIFVCQIIKPVIFFIRVIFITCDFLLAVATQRVKFHGVAGASEVATRAMMFWQRRNYYMKEEQHRNNIYVCASS